MVSKEKQEKTVKAKLPKKPSLKVPTEADAKIVLEQSKAKLHALQSAIEQIEKRFGKGSIMKLGSNERTKVDVISSGAISLDIALGVGGVPKGRIIEIYGPEASGKTTFALHILAECQRAGGVAAFVDAEHALDPIYARVLGVDVDNLLLSQPDYGEQALEIVETLIRSGGVDLIVVDSVAALTPKSEIEGEMGDASMGSHARLMSQAMRKLTAIANKSNTTLVFLNQIRMKIGVLFGNPETTTGGMALKFYSSVRMEVRSLEKLKDVEGKMIGNRVRVKIVKNKMAPPFREAELVINYGSGVDKTLSLIDAGLSTDVLKKSGSWFSYDGKQLGQGADALKQLFDEKPELAKKIDSEVRKKAGLI